MKNYCAKELRKGMVVNIQWVEPQFHETCVRETCARWHGLPGMHDAEVSLRRKETVYLYVGDLGSTITLKEQFLLPGFFFREGFCGLWTVSEIPPTPKKLKKGEEWYLAARNLWPDEFRWKQGRKLLWNIGSAVNNYGYGAMLRRLQQTNRVKKLSRGRYAWCADAPSSPPVNIWGTNRLTFRTRKFL